MHIVAVDRHDHLWQSNRSSMLNRCERLGLTLPVAGNIYTELPQQIVL